jgi:hypothetical protein
MKALSIREAIATEPLQTIVVLDDDPTGTQTVHDLPVLTTLGRRDIERGIYTRHGMFLHPYEQPQSRTCAGAEAESGNRSQSSGRGMG